jgi:hypothetical protein
MNVKRKFATRAKTIAATAGLALLTIAAAARMEARNWSLPANPTQQTVAARGKFFCNIQAWSPAERAHHKQLTDKLRSLRKEVIETAKGYEFQYSPADVSISELADWVAAEGKCCPFFDFHIDLEQEGRLLCLRLTGEEGIKAFTRSEFQVATH